MMMLRNYSQLPPIVNGYELDDRFSVLVPIARTNLVINPSFETNTTSWTAIGGSIARVTTFQYHGAYSLAITPSAAITDGARFDTVSLVSGTTYAYQSKVLGVAGKSYKLAIETTAGVELSSRTFVATGRWQWMYGYYTETSTTTRRVTVRKAGGAELSIFYIDGIQVEALGAGESVSTYLDGAQLGLVPNQFPPAYVWNGTPHGSTSQRSGLTRAGGMVMKFRDFGFLITAIIGLGLALPINIQTDYARIDGGYDDYTRKPSRQFTLTGNFESRAGYRSLRDQRGGLARLLDRDLVAQDQELILLRDVLDECGELSTTTCRISGKYQGGLDGNTDNHAAQTVPISFTQSLPFIFADGESGATLAPQQNVAANFFVQRSAGGVYSSLNGGANNITRAVLYASNGRLYAAGDFTTIGGVAATRIAYYDFATGVWSAMGTGANGSVLTLVEGADGSIYVGGAFTAMGGVANTSRIAKWNPVTLAWSSITPLGAANASINDMVIAPDNTLIVVGAFTTINGVASNFIHKYTIATGVWSASYGAGPAGGGVSAVTLKGILPYVATFTNGVRFWNGSAWSTIGTYTGAEQVLALYMGLNGILYAGGSITALNGIAMNSIGSYNGVTWTPLGNGLLNTVGGPGTNNVLAISQLPNGIVVVGGNFDTTGAVTILSSLAAWNGSTWTYFDINLGWNEVQAFATRNDGSLAIAGSDTTTATAAVVTTLNNIGTARSYPTITINGPTSGTARIYMLFNVTTGRSIYLNLTLSAGEVATMVFTPDNLSFTSTIQGNIASAILPGSNTAEFFLTPGANGISLYAGSSTITATVSWRPSYVSLDDVP